jgi:hypothetical protein
MKMKNLLSLIAVLGLLLSVNSYGQSTVSGVFNKSSSGTTSATVIIEESNDFSTITDLAYKLDAGVTTGFVSAQIGQSKYKITSATASAASVLWFDNTASDIAAQDFVIFHDKSTGTYYLRKVSAASTTSATLYASISVTTVVTDDSVWSTYAAVEKPVTTVTSGTTGAVNIWIPAAVPAAYTIDGNTTACRISVSGVRTRSR